jgi:Holliday junction resolvase-like predicted endonuclease
MTEAQIQAKIIDRYEKDGYMVVKLIQTSKNGIPDLLLLKDGIASFVEVKTETGRLSELQKFRIKQLEEKGFKVEVLHK